MTLDRQIYNRTPPMMRQREGNTSYLPFKRREMSNDLRGVVVKRCHNCGSDRHLVKDCVIPPSGATARNMYT